MIEVNFDPRDLSSELRDIWNRLQEDVQDAIEENIRAWETWKQLERYQELQKAPEAGAENSEMATLKLALQPFLTVEGNVKPEYISAKPRFNFGPRQRIWAAIKHFLIEQVFHHKCAYCEIQTEQFYFDAEHYRPKGEVTVIPEGQESANRVLVKDERGEDTEHPGYFWLAFDWKNLVPSCKSCNGPGGKMTQFPVGKAHILVKRLTPQELAALDPPPYSSVAWPGLYYLRTEQLDLYEEPLLLHPYLHGDNSPRQHIRFREKGIEYAVNGSLKGSRSIEAFRLYRDSLRTARQKAQENAFNTLIGAYLHYLRIEHRSPEESWKKAHEEISEYVEGREAFCAAVLDYVHIALKPLGASSV